MANSFCCLDYHFVFSTKCRYPWISPKYETQVWEYLGGTAVANRMHPYKIGGMPDHLHVAIGLPPTLAVSDAVRLLKGSSSRWIRDAFPTLKGFGWQDGYGAFTVSRSNVPQVVDYIAGQREHHRTRTFQEEYRELLARHGIPFDERYLWG